MQSFRPRHLVAAFSLAFLTSPSLFASAPEISADEIIRRATLRDEQLRRERQRYQCDLRVTTEKLDGTDAVVSTKTLAVVMRPAREIAVGGEVASGANDKEAVEAKKFLAVMDLQKLAPRFEMSREADGESNGRACYVVRYRPRVSQRADTKEEKAMNGLTGRFWVARDDFSILQSEGTLAQPVTIMLVASVYRLDFTYRSCPLPNGDPAPACFQLVLGVKAPLYEMRQRQTSTMSNYR